MVDFIPNRFVGKRAVVTGAGSGIGRATAIRLHQEGAEVIATDVSAERLEQLKGDLGGDRLETVVGDISRQATTDAVMTAAQGAVQCLVNNAGIMDNFLPAAEMDDAVWDRVLAVNLTAIMRLTRAVLPSMIAAAGGTIVNVSSEAGLRGACAGAAYTASKFAVNGFTLNTAFMYAQKNIRVNAVAPGATATNIEAPFHSEFAASRIGPLLQAVVPPTATAEQLAAAICWLLSDDSANVNGAILPSDGVWSAI